MRDYGKVYSTFWSSPTVTSLPDDAKVLALYVLTCTHSTIAGVFRMPDGYVSEDLGWTVERVQKGFAELFANGFANRCETTKWIWVIKHLTWNPPDNPNQRKAAAKVAIAVPDECSWKREFMRVCGQKLGIEEPPTTNPSATVGEPSRNQEQKQKAEAGPEAEAEAEEKPLSTAELPTLPVCPHKKLISLFTTTVAELPRPRAELWAGKNADAMRARWKWVLTAEREDGKRYATTENEAIAWFAKFFDTVAASDFLTGRSGKWASCDQAWLMKADNFAKVVQGNYFNDTRKAA